MTLGGWIILILSVTGVTAFMAWCLRKVLLTNRRPCPHAHKKLPR